MRGNPQRIRADVRALPQQKLAEIERQISALNAFYQELQLLIDSCSCSQQGCPIINNIEVE